MTYKDNWHSAKGSQTLYGTNEFAGYRIQKAQGYAYYQIREAYTNKFIKTIGPVSYIWVHKRAEEYLTENFKNNTLSTFTNK